MLKGWRTIIVGLLFALGPVALQYLAGVDWEALGVPVWLATMINGGLMVVMRGVTSTPLGRK